MAGDGAAWLNCSLLMEVCSSGLGPRGWHPWGFEDLEKRFIPHAQFQKPDPVLILK